MDLSLADLSILIELTEREMIELQSLIDNSPSQEIVNDSGESLVTVSITASKLKKLYEQKWSPDCNYCSYKELVRAAHSFKT
ncbi:hypothetical protein [Aliikangiella sp. G2MR2-5]|uniref:hypothetical protein n=1 Tax=Aliikangiella sp. G2MR2-5 TaxID=2788943 RepID=UPI0018AB8458|nr:hypothetical protein [Aliikangiella sp. G2MR2-5]